MVCRVFTLIAFVELPLATLLAANLVMFFASAVQASVGVGIALVSVPLLALLHPQLVPGPMLAAGSLVALVTALRERQAIRVGGFGLSLAGLALGTVIGALALDALHGPDVERVFAVLILIAVGLSVAGLRVRPSPLSLGLGGTAAGIMGTMVGIHGPPISIVFQHARLDYARAMLGAFFFIAYVASCLALAVFGLFGVLELKRAAALLPGVCAGLLVAPRVAGRVSQAQLRAAILLVSAGSAVLLLLR
jgi:uncharacterized membrane protein YfcA